MKKIALLLLFLRVVAFAQQPLKNGDLLFQNLDCGPLCSAIEEVTHGHDGLKFSHIGLVYVKQDSVYIIEAIGSAVQLTPLQQFVARTKNPLYWGRVKKAHQHLIDSALAFSIQQLGVPYDDPFLYNNHKYYCSELIYDAFKAANHNNDFFVLEPMTFKQPASKTFYPAWVDYYRELGIDIPEGLPGINPAGISRSNKLEWLGVYTQDK